MMGSHAHMLSPAERWKVIHYVKSLSMANGASPAAPAKDSTKVN